MDCRWGGQLPGCLPGTVPVLKTESPVSRNPHPAQSWTNWDSWSPDLVATICAVVGDEPQRRGPGTMPGRE